MDELLPMPEVTSLTAQATTASAVFHSLKTFFLGFCTEYREVASNDVLLRHLVDAVPSYIRLRKISPRSDVVCIGVEVGADADLLQESSADPEHQFPFDTVAGGEVDLRLSWEPGRHFVSVMLGQSMEAVYRWTYDFRNGEASLFHQNYHRPGSEPNFLETTTPYVKVGA